MADKHPTPFHLSLAVPDLDAVRTFYVDVFGCRITREHQHWLDLDFFGHQLTLHRASATKPARAIDHFGINLDRAAWDRLAAACREHGADFALQPQTIGADAGGAGYEKFVVRDPAGNRVEFKFTGGD